MKGIRIRLISSFDLLGLALLAASTTARALPTLPNINTNNVITITNAPYNGKGDGVFTNTAAIQSAIDAASAGGTTNGLVGGTVRIPAPGTFLTGPLTFKNNVNLQIDAGATLKMFPMSIWTNLPPQNQTFGNLLYASGVTNVEISGSGTIDGQGAAWWTSPTSVFNARAYMIYFNGNCKRVLIQDVKMQNPPKMHVVFKGRDDNITIQGITINTTAGNAANTDGIDLVGTSCLVQNCVINAGDDNIALGTSANNTPSTDILITNCVFGKGHGLSIGSNTQGGVSNITVINCSFNGTTSGIRMKSDNNSSGGSGQGGVTQNLLYQNIAMTNVTFPVLIYSYYSEVGTPSSITPSFAAAEAVESVTGNTPVWRDITISNLTVVGGVNCVIWSRGELPATNIVFYHANISATKAFEIYNARGVKFVDSQITTPAASTLLLYNAEVIISNSAPSATVTRFDGLTTNGVGNNVALYLAQATLKNTNVFDRPLTLDGSTLTVGNHLNLGTSAVNFALGTNDTTIVVASNLVLGATINVTAGSGFTNGTYTIFTYNQNLDWEAPMLGSAPAGYNYSWDTNTVGRVNLVVQLPGPSLTPPQISSQLIGDQLRIEWPPDHIGWKLQIQTNSLSDGFGTNWLTVDESIATNQITIPIAPANGAVFLRMVSP